MLRLLLLAVIALPVLEVVVLVAVAQAIGWLPTIALVIGAAIAGLIVARRQGVGVLRRLRNDLRAGRLPTTDLIDAAALVLAAGLLIAPGMLTDVLGLMLVIPRTRRFLASTFLLATPWGRRVQVASGLWNRYRGRREERADDANIPYVDRVHRPTRL